MFLALIHRTEHHKWTIGIIISIIVLALGLFLYMQNEGEDVGLTKTESNAASSSSQILEAQVQGEPMVVSSGQETRPFILAIIPGDAVLDGGSYRAPAGSTLQVHVRAVNTEGGVLYFKPKDSKQIEVQAGERVGDLTPSSDLPGEFVASFDLKKDMSGLLIAVMNGKDGQTAQLSVNVASK